MLPDILQQQLFEGKTRGTFRLRLNKVRTPPPPEKKARRRPKQRRKTSDFSTRLEPEQIYGWLEEVGDVGDIGRGELACWGVRGTPLTCDKLFFPF